MDAFDSSLSRRAREISEATCYEYEDAKSALSRSFKYFVDIGKNGDDALEEAVEFTARAVEAAPRFGFELRPMVDYMLFGIFHRVPTRERVTC